MAKPARISQLQMQAQRELAIFAQTAVPAYSLKNSSAPGGIGIAAGSFDQTDWFKPQAILYVADRPELGS